MTIVARCVLRRSLSPAWPRPAVNARTLATAAPSLSSVEETLKARKTKIVYDTLSPMPSHLLDISLLGYLPPTEPAAADTNHPPLTLASTRSRAPSSLPLGHHLVYFPSQMLPSQLLSDGTDPDHSPGEPFVRRMWAGGSVTFAKGWEDKFKLDGRRVACVESVEGARLKGIKESPSPADISNEKAFVDVYRRYGTVKDDGDVSSSALARDQETVVAGPVIDERRTLVFLREKTAEQAAKDAATTATKVVKALHKPDFSISLVPRQSLLFHFSALTFNAHAIHLDKQYCRELEGHRNLLVHGPLSLLLMMTAAQRAASSKSASSHGARLKTIEYRNLAPLYADELVKVCVRANGAATSADEKKWDVWVEGPTGGLSVKASAITVSSLSRR